MRKGSLAYLTPAESDELHFAFHLAFLGAELFYEQEGKWPGSGKYADAAAMETFAIKMLTSNDIAETELPNNLQLAMAEV